MEKLRKVIYLILCVITVAVMLASVLSVFRDTPSNYMKMLDFPRQQWFLLSAITMVLFIIMTKHWRWYDYALVVGLVGGLVINGVYLVHYTPLFPDRVPQAAADHDPADRVSVLLANVLEENRNAQPFLARIREKDPDFVVAMEVDAWWDEQLRPIEANYPHIQESVNDVGYGLTLYSKYPFSDMEVNRLNNERVPSFETKITLDNGRTFELHVVHPVPPKDFASIPDNQGQQEVAMLKVGEKVANNNLPDLIVGDLNDVVWGYTDLLTGTKNEVFDTRVGRGFYNSFDAHKWYMRWPLDHVFVTKEFQLHKLERLERIGSDHWPIYAELVLPGG